MLKDDTFVFRYKDGQFVVDGDRKLQISRQGDCYYLMDPVTQLVYIFRSRVKNTQRPFQFVRRMGEVLYIMDRNGNRLSFSYNADNNPTLIEDGLGRRLVFSYSQNGNLSSVSDGQGRTFTFAYNQNSRLASFTDPAGRTTRFEYDSEGRLARYILPLGNSPFTQTWEERRAPAIGWMVPSVTSQTDAFGNILTLDYDWRDEQLTAHFPDGSATTHESFACRYPTKMTDAEGNSVSYARR